ncbi:hypothetical protein CC86DRAFT_292924 [Ophiobolus disseminans]|uniref:Ribonuclease n=1 Tax=Ophiobolus disseminans TaxID=1469910 RepID=A0A6A7A146_9PLEO|nr:hypothetical protein CC86DRAFT_292924 [Ophiobolus disseminans]
MADTLDDAQMDAQEAAHEMPPADVFMAPSVHTADILAGRTYSHFSEIPQLIAHDMSREVVLGVDEAGRGPVLGPMVYALFYLPLELHRSLLAETHRFDDSKVLTPAFRSGLMRTLCTAGTDLHEAGGWATRSLSAQDISAHMLSPSVYNLNAQAMDATIDLIKGVLARGVNVTDIYIDTIGRPEIYQKKLERIWPTIRITVAKKADSLYPVVSAASVCAKVTRDAALEVCYEPYHARAVAMGEIADDAEVGIPWGSGYPSDPKLKAWLKHNMDPLFGWGSECRFSWGTAKELLEGNKPPVNLDWPAEDDGNDMRMTDFFVGKNESAGDELADWYGKRVSEDMQVF